MTTKNKKPKITQKQQTVLDDLIVCNDDGMILNLYDGHDGRSVRGLIDKGYIRIEETFQCGAWNRWAYINK